MISSVSISSLVTNHVTIPHTKQGQSIPQRTTQRKQCDTSEPRAPFDLGFAPLDESGEGLKAEGNEGVKSICVAYGIRRRLRMSLIHKSTLHSGLNLALFKAGLSTHSLNSFERGLRRGWTDSFSQSGKEGKKACYGRDSEERLRERERLWDAALN